MVLQCLKWASVSALLVVAGFVLHRCYRHYRGIEVCVKNVDGQALLSGQVQVKATYSSRDYLIGDLAPGAEACVWVKADHESAVAVRFAASRKEIWLDGYIEPGYSGSISAEVTATGARSIRSHVDPY